jgi:protein-tyrosine-phosphatase
MKNKNSILLLDTYNATRTIAAEALLRKYGRHQLNVSSAGISTNKETEDLIKIYNKTLKLLDGHYLPTKGLVGHKSVDRFMHKHFDYVVTMSDAAHKHCPIFIGTYIKMQWFFKDIKELPDLNLSEIEITICLRENINKAFWESTNLLNSFRLLNMKLI